MIRTMILSIAVACTMTGCIVVPARHYAPAPVYYHPHYYHYYYGY